ncbi:MAG TPA: LysM peptidoglycan-binding domain-containing protein [Bacteroidia bacterium]|nr:LysM peptidoglycan-binding domain-containing protein [Bacteroidia bacterium]
MYRKLPALLIFLFLFGEVKAQRDTVIFADDPVAAMLDSLAHNAYISRIPRQQTQRNNKFHFAEDSIPVYDNAVIESRLAKLNAQSPFDLVYNEDVQTYIDLYTMKRRPLVEKMLGLSQLYYPIFEEKLDKYNLPLELKHLAVIESALNPSATSRAGARGLWQFMYTTGSVYGLQMTSYVDERCDPYKSTEAACQLLQNLYSMFGDWQMVLAAYNAGPGAVNKAIRRAGGGKKTYWEIRPYLPRETQAYVPAFIAANYVMTYHAEHNLFATAPRKVFFDVDTVAVKQQVTFSQLEAVLGISYDELEFLNPMYKLGVIPVSFGEPYHLVLPVGQVGAFVTNEEKIYDYIKTDTAMSALAVQEVKSTHVVKKGETITSIARKYKCSVTDIRSWNSLRTNYLKPGQKLIIYTTVTPPPPQDNTASKDKPPSGGTTAKPKTPPASNTASASAGDKYEYYTVKNGDNLWTIANKTGTTVDELKKLNGFGSKIVLHTGDRIKVKKL